MASANENGGRATNLRHVCKNARGTSPGALARRHTRNNAKKHKLQFRPSLALAAQKQSGLAARLDSKANAITTAPRLPPHAGGGAHQVKHACRDACASLSPRGRNVRSGGADALNAPPVSGRYKLASQPREITTQRVAGHDHVVHNLRFQPPASVKTTTAPKPKPLKAQEQHRTSIWGSLGSRIP